MSETTSGGTAQGGAGNPPVSASADASGPEPVSAQPLADEADWVDASSDGSDDSDAGPVDNTVDTPADMMAMLQKMLGLGIGGEKTEPKPPLFDSFDVDGVVAYIKDKQPKNIIVMTGAGISTSAGVFFV